MLEIIRKWWSGHKTKTFGFLVAAGAYLQGHIDMIHEWFRDEAHFKSAVFCIGLVIIALGFANGSTAPSSNRDPQ